MTTMNKNSLTAVARNAALGQVRDYPVAAEALLRILVSDAANRRDALENVVPTDAGTIGRLQGELCYIRDLTVALGGVR